MKYPQCTLVHVNHLSAICYLSVASTICNHLSQVCLCHLITCWWKPSLSVSDGFHFDTIACKEAKSCKEGKYNTLFWFGSMYTESLFSLWMYDHYLGRANLLPWQQHCTLHCAWYCYFTQKVLWIQMLEL